MNSYIWLHDIAQRGCLSGTCHGVCGVSRQVGYLVPVSADFLASIQGIFRGVPALEGPSELLDQVCGPHVGLSDEDRLRSS